MIFGQSREPLFVPALPAWQRQLSRVPDPPIWHHVRTDGSSFVNGWLARTATMWNPSDKDAGVTLSGGNLTYTAAAINVAVRSTNPLSTGKAYWEIVVNPAVGEVGGVWNLGFTDAATSFASMRTAGTINMIVLFNGVISNSGATSLVTTFVGGDSLCMAVDFGAKLSWFRRNGGNWNGSALNDPATAVGGISFATAGPYYANAASSEIGTSYTANFGATAFSFTKPSGFTSWNGLA